MKSHTIWAVGILLLALASSGCTRFDDAEQACVDRYMEKFNLQWYHGQGLDCKDVLALSEYKGQLYFTLSNNCADMIIYPFDCDGNKICLDGDDPVCKDFWANAKSFGIIGVSEH